MRICERELFGIACASLATVVSIVAPGLAQAPPDAGVPADASATPSTAPKVPAEQSALADAGADAQPNVAPEAPQAEVRSEPLRAKRRRARERLVEALEVRQVSPGTMDLRPAPFQAHSAGRAAPAELALNQLWNPPHYDLGFVLISSPRPPAEMPFLLRLNHVSQFKYSNTMAVDETFTDHLGRERPVLRRNDIQLTRDVFYFSGFAFDPHLDFNILLYTSSATLSATAAGYVGYVFADAFALRAGFFSLPSVRSLTGTYPFFHGTDRSLATNYFRPGFTQGVWANGEHAGFNYIAMVGNSLNTLDISANKIDFNLAYSASVWYDLNEFGKPWNDYENHLRPAVRAGGAFTWAREDRLSDLSQSSPENNATFISDGTLLFETGSLAPDVTVELANFYLMAIDAGIKYRGLAFNAEFYQRWLNNFEADGPLPLTFMEDWGFEASLGYFVLPSKLETYIRGSYVNGPFNIGYEGAVGFHWYPVSTRWVWLSAEVIGIKDSPYGSVLYIYSAGQTGLLVPVQFLLRF